MKTFILNGSPRYHGNTADLLDHFISYLSEEYKLIRVYDSNLMPCMDCRYCQTHDGCAIPDEMKFYYRDVIEADNIVLASPLYFDELTGALLNFCSRFQYFYQRRATSSLYQGKKKKGFLLLTGGGSSSSVHHAEETAKLIFSMLHAELVGTAYSLSTDTLPAKEDAFALESVKALALEANKD